MDTITITKKLNVKKQYDVIVCGGGGDYMGIKGRFKRAWKAFWAKPVCYNEVYCMDGKRMRKFLEDCLNLMEEVGE